MDNAMKTDMKQNAIPGFTANCKGDLAIITGGTSGIGLSFALHAAQYGMVTIVLDIATKKFPQIEAQLRTAGAPEVLCIECDVSNWNAVQAIGNRVKKSFGGKNIGLICANAGFGGPPILNSEPDKITEQFDVNLNGVIWTFKAFQKQFLKQKKACALVATSSIAGVVNAGGTYGVSKHACLAVMEALYSELLTMGKTHVKTYVLCPGVVKTNITTASFARRNPNKKRSKMEEVMGTAFGDLMEEKGMSPTYVVKQVFEGIESGKFYLILDQHDNDMYTGVQEHMHERYMRMKFGCPPAKPGRIKFPLQLQIIKRAQKIFQSNTESKL